jgi:hypothetical protein
MDAGEMGAGVKTVRPFILDEFVAEYTGDLVDSLKTIKTRRRKYRWKEDETQTIPCYEFQFHFRGKKYWLVYIYIY